MATKKATTENKMMQQFNDLKAKHPDALILFRCGDFYETYEDDAKDASDILGITLTKQTSTGIRMAGFPHHALDTYLPKLIRAGKRVAICDQLNEPKNTKKMDVVDEVKPAEKQPEDMTIAELMQAYKAQRAELEMAEAKIKACEDTIQEIAKRAEVAEAKLNSIKAELNE